MFTDLQSFQSLQMFSGLNLHIPLFFLGYVSIVYHKTSNKKSLGTNK